MQDRYVADVREGMTVEDADGDKIGTVDTILVARPVSPTAAATDEARLKVSTGLFGLGGSLYIPVSAIRDVVDDRVILTVDKSKTDTMGWEEKPAWIEE